VSAAESPQVPALRETVCALHARYEKVFCQLTGIEFVQVERRGAASGGGGGGENRLRGLGGV
jgi:hypothetical protein